jgi:hypothetical protein
VKKFLYSFVFLLLVPLSGCSTLYRYTIGIFDEDINENQNVATSITNQAESSPVDSSISRKGVAIQGAASDREQRREDIEILWKIPQEEVEGFIISYRIGQSGKPLQEKVYAENLEKFDEKSVGFVYRYVVRDIPSSHTVYATIASFRGDQVSSPSEVITALSATERGEKPEKGEKVGEPTETLDPQKQGTPINKATIN